MELGRVVKRVLVVKRGQKPKTLLGCVGRVDFIDSKNVEIYIDGSTYQLGADAVEILPHSLES